MSSNGTSSVPEPAPISIITGKPLRAPLFYESMTEIRDLNSKAKVRGWRREEEFPEYLDAEIIAIFGAIPDGASMRDIANAIGSIDRVTAIELTDANGCGAVIYLEW